MKKSLIVGSFFLAACSSGPHMTLMVNPISGERKECRADIIPNVAIPLTPLNQARRENCIEQYRGLGFIQASELTPEQRQTITPRSSAPTINIEK